MAQRRNASTPGGSRRPGQREQTPRARVAASSPGGRGGETDSVGREGSSAPRASSASSGSPRGVEGRTVRGTRGGAPVRKRPRLTGRAAILLLVVLVLAVSYASSMRAYFDQRAHIQSLKEQIADSEANISELEREKRRWDDPAYVRAQARSHLGYLMPGETGFQVLDEDGNPLDSVSDLSDPDEVLKEKPTAWWETVWGSVELAGDPPPEQPSAPSVIDGVKKNKQEKQ